MKLFKAIASIVGVVVTLIMIAVAAVVLLVPADHFKPQISQFVSEQTGKQLEIDGKLHWSVYPQLGITVDNVKLNDDAAFNNTTFANANSLTIQAQLIPLLSKQIKISSIRIDGLTLNLIKNSNGQKNWEFKSPKQTSSTTEQTVPSTSDQQAKALNIDINKIIVANSTIIYNDQQTHQKTAISDLSLRIKDLRANTTFPIKAAFYLGSANSKAKVNINTHVRYHSKDQNLTLSHLTLKFTQDHTPIDFRSPELQLNFSTEKLSLPSFTVEYSDINAKGSLKADHLFKKPIWQGSVSTEPFNLRAVAKKLGHPLNLTDKNALTQTQLNGKIDVSPTAINITNLAGKIDNMQVSGTIGFNLSPVSVRLSLYTSELNLDRYLPSNSGPQKTHASNNNQNLEGSNRQPSQAKNTTDGFTVFGDIGVGRLITDGITMTNVKSGISLKNSVFTADNFRANVFDGSTSGLISVNFQNNFPIIRLRQNMRNIDMQQLQKVLLGEGKLAGRGNVQADVSFSGTTSTAIIRSLNGNASIDISNGRIYGADIDYELSKARLTLLKLPGKGVQSRGFTPFTRFHANANFGEGILHNNNLDVRSSTLSITGNGRLNMLNKGINYKVGAQSLQKMDIKTDLFSLDLAEYRIPVTIRGTLDNPQVSLSLADITRLAVQKQLKNVIKKTIIKPEETIREGIKKLLPF